MIFAIKAEIGDQELIHSNQRAETMYGGKQITTGDTIFIIASENEGGPGSSPAA